MIKHFFSFLLLCLSLTVMAQDGNSKFHEVKAGETFYSLSRKYDVSVERLQKYNPDLKDGLNIGDNVLIPPKQEGEVGVERSTRFAGPDSSMLIHTVKLGETLFSLSQVYGVEIAEIRKHNPQVKDGLNVGQELKIPYKEKKKKETPAEMLENFYVIEIEPKQTAYSISKQYEISLDSIYLLNPGAEDGLQIGQYLKLPKNRQPEDETVVEKEAQPEPEDQLNRDVVTPKPQQPAGPGDKDKEGYLLYQVKTGDSFYSLNQRYHVSREELIALNPEVARGLEVDKYIIIPQEREEQKEETFFDKLFRKIEETDDLPEPNKDQIARRDSLNGKLEFPEELKPRVNLDTIEADLDKNFLVGVMLPFKSNDSISGEIGPVQKMAMDFYNGFSMAADSLTNAGMHLTLNVYDTKNSRTKLEKDINRIKRTNFDLIVGPLYKSNVEFVADHLNADNVPVVSPLSRTVEVQNRPNLINVLPGNEATAENIARILDNMFPGANIIFAHGGDEENRQLVRQIKARLRPRDTGKFVGSAVSVEGESLSRKDLEDAMVENTRNVVVILSEDKVFLSSLVNSLRQLKSYKVTAVGPSRLLDVPTLDLSYLNDMRLTMTDMHYVNYQDSATVDFIRHYRKKFADEPTRYAFQGYDVGMYFLNKLWRSGSFFLLSIQEEQPMMSTGFNIRKNKGGGYENDFLFTTGIRDFTLLKLDANKEEPKPTAAGEGAKSSGLQSPH